MSATDYAAIRSIPLALNQHSTLRRFPLRLPAPIHFSCGYAALGYVAFSNSYLSILILKQRVVEGFVIAFPTDLECEAIFL